VLHSKGNKNVHLAAVAFPYTGEDDNFCCMSYSYIDTGTLFFCLHNIFLGCVQVSCMARICFMPTEYLSISCSVNNHAVSFLSSLLLTLMY
jgi:hypothetical protein